MFELDPPFIGGLVGAAILLFWSIGAHNRLVALRSAIGQAWAQIDEPLQRRHVLLPALVTLLRPQMPQEHGALDAVLAASGQTLAAAGAVQRRPGDADAAATLVIAEQTLAAALQRLQTLLEPQPDLLALPEVVDCRSELNVMEQRLIFRRQLYNQAVHRYNEAVRQFPTNLLTPLFRFAPAGLL